MQDISRLEEITFRVTAFLLDISEVGCCHIHIYSRPFSSIASHHIASASSYEVFNFYLVFYRFVGNICGVNRVGFVHAHRSSEVKLVSECISIYFIDIINYFHLWKRWLLINIHQADFSGVVDRLQVFSLCCGVTAGMAGWMKIES